MMLPSSISAPSTLVPMISAVSGISTEKPNVPRTCDGHAHRRVRGFQRDREQDQDHRGQREQQRPPAAQRRAQGDPRDRGVEHAAP
jgi:hypothetical protein